jgi:hypothetical protein
MGGRETAIAIALFLCILLPGCSTPGVAGTAPEAGRETGQQAAYGAGMDGPAVLAKFMENREHNRFKDYKSEADADAAVYVNGTLLGNVRVEGQANVSSGRRGHAVFDIALSSPLASRNLRQEYYLVDGRLFSQSGGTWAERSLPPEMPDVFNSQPDLAVGLLDLSVLALAGEEDVKGVPCHVLAGPWDPSEAIAFALALAGGSVPVAGAVTEADYRAAGGNVTLWISKDTYALMKHERIASVIVRNASRVDARETMAYYDQGVANYIEIPAALLQQ